MLARRLTILCIIVIAFGIVLSMLVEHVRRNSQPGTVNVQGRSGPE